MLHRFRLNIKRCCALAGATFLLAFALALTVSCGGSSSGTGPAARTVPPAEVGQLGSMLFYLGPASLEERVAGADVIARVRLRSVSSGAELQYIYDDGVLRHVAVLKHRFEVLEYLKGSGGGELVAVVHELVDHETAERAAESAAVLLAERDMRWDRREAIIFLWYGFRQRDRYLLGTVLNAEYYGDYFKDHYTIESPHEQKWLPAASTGSGEQLFLLDVPGTVPSDGSGQAASVPTITLAEMKAKIAEIEREAVAGGGSEAYRECLYHKYRWEREVRYRKGGTAGDYFYIRHDHAIGSGLPAGTRAFTDPHGGSGETAPADGSELQIMGRDARWFSVRWPGVADAARPLPAGEYRFYYTYVPGRYVICDGEPEEEKKRQEVFVQVTAPEGALHEAFFDPVTDGSAVAADTTNGVLKPASFTDTSGATSTIQRIAWESGSVEMRPSPHTGLAGHRLDFIELDGTVSLSLSVSDATVDAPNATLSWPVPYQPWEDGDKLMLRIREALPYAPAPASLTAVSSAMDAADLSWAPVSGASGYRVQRRESGQEAWRSVDASVTGTTHTASGLRCGTAYEFRVGAYGDGTTYDQQAGLWSATATAVTGECDLPPVFATSTYAFSVDAGAATGTAVGRVSATDPEGGAVSYSITAGDQGGLFAIATTTGQVSVAKPLFHNAAPSHTLTVRASDSAGGTATTTARISVTSACHNGVVVPDPDANPALVGDCLVLYHGVMQTLAGTASLGWGADTSITAWRGVQSGGEPRRVRGLLLADLGLNGTIPAELGLLAALTRLDLDGNDLGGEIPPELGQLSNLDQLYLFDNDLTGKIPPELGDLANLTRLDLDTNRLTGAIPSELGQLSRLEALYLFDNDLSGAIPAELGDLANLELLYLSGNRLSGQIPETLGSLGKLKDLVLGRNRLSGAIPAELGGLANLEELRLHDNSLTGAIPAALTRLSLDALYLSGNTLAGCVPLALKDVATNDLDDLGLPDCPR